MRLLPLVCGIVAVVAAALAHAQAPRTIVNQKGALQFPGEFESHEAMWLAWPTYENMQGKPSTVPMLQMIKAMHGHVRIHLLVQDGDDEAAARSLMQAENVPFDHVKFFRIPHGDIWIRDMGPQMIRDGAGNLAIADWNFNMWGHEEPDSEASLVAEKVDRLIAQTLDIVVVAAPQANGQRMIHEGGGVTHNGYGTMVAAESVAMQRSLGPKRFCGGEAPATEYRSPTTYKPHTGWAACKRRLEEAYKQVIGVKKVIWVPTGVIEDDGPYRGPLGKHLQMGSFGGERVSHPGVYSMFTTNGHADEFIRFVNPTTIVLAETPKPAALPAGATDLQKLVHLLEGENHKRLEAAAEVIRNAKTADGKAIRLVRLPTPEFMFDLYRPGDAMYDYYAEYDRWEDPARPGRNMFVVLPTSYGNFLPTNDLVLLAKYWKPGMAEAIKAKDAQAEAVLRSVFPDRSIARIDILNVNRGGGGVFAGVYRVTPDLGTMTLLIDDFVLTNGLASLLPG